MARPKVIVQIYPMLPAADRAERERLRPLGRNAELYHKVLHETVDLVKEIDKLGAWGISTIEHHFHSEGYEVGPNPGVLNAFWASHVKRARLGALGYVMGTRDPIRVAEETAILDHMTNGRFFVGVTRGYQSRWLNTLGQNIDAVATVSDGSADDQRNREIFEERVGMLMECWTQESINFKHDTYEAPYPHETGVVDYPARKSIETAGGHGELGPDGSIQRHVVVPSLYSDPHPPLFAPMSGSAASIPFLAKNGIRPVYFSPLAVLRGFAEDYVEVGRSVGKEYALGERQCIARWVHLGDENEFLNKIVNYDVEMYEQHYQTFYPKMQFGGREETLKGMLASGIFTGGTLEQLKTQWRDQYEQLPAEYITLVWHYAQVPMDVMLEELSVFMDQVVPELDAPSSE